MNFDIHLIVKDGGNMLKDLEMTADLRWTIDELKRNIVEKLSHGDVKLEPARIKLIFAGQLLRTPNMLLSQVFAQVPVQL